MHLRRQLRELVSGSRALPGKGVLPVQVHGAELENAEPSIEPNRTGGETL